MTIQHQDPQTTARQAAAPVLRDLGQRVQFKAHALVESDAIDIEARTVWIAWASEFAGGRRAYGYEVLDCSPRSIRLGRLSDGGPLLFNHESGDLIGVVERIEIGADRVCRALVRFDTCEEAEKRWQQVLNRVLRHVSVSYVIWDLVLESSSDGVDTYRAIDWEPYELSFVSIPFDHSVGVGRSADTTPPDQSLPNTVPASIKEHPVSETTQQPASPSAESLDLKRRDAIVELGVKYADYLTLNDVQTFCRDAKTPQQLQDLVIERMKTKHSDTRAAHIGMSPQDAKTYSIGKAVRAMLTGDWKEAGLEREASEAACKRFGGQTKGVLIPFDVMSQRDFTAGTAAEAGNLISTSLRTDLFSDVLRNKLAMGRLGATMLFGLSANIDIPRKIAGTSLGFVAETADLAETGITTGKISMGPKRIGGYIEFSKQAVIQSAMAVEPLLRADILDEYALQFETMGLSGSGASNQPRGIRNTSGIGAVVGGTNGAALTWAHLVALETACADANSEPDARAGYLVNTRTRGWTKTTQKAANLPFIWSETGTPLNGYRTEVSNMVPRTLTKGTSSGNCSNLTFSSNWSSLIMGTFGAVELLVDETSQAINGLNRLVLNAFVDVAVRRAADFAVMEDALVQ